MISLVMKMVLRLKKTHLDSSISLKHVSIAQNMYSVLGEGGGGYGGAGECLSVILPACRL